MNTEVKSVAGVEQAAAEVTDLVVSFGHTEVLHSVNLTVPTGRVVGLVGESGSGKSTLGKALVGINKSASGSIKLGGREVSSLNGKQRRDLRRIVQYIPQDPYASLSPRRTIAQTLAEAIDPRHASPKAHRAAIEQVLEQVRIDPSAAAKYPHQFSGGQRQRIAIARALVLRPDVIVADEITSALDVSVQAEILDLLARLRQESNYSMLFISHNLAVVQQVCDDIAVMYRGDILETGPIDEVYRNPTHPYTRKLLDSVPGSPNFSID